MTCLKQQTVEREKTRRRKRVGIGGEGYDPMNPNDPGGSDDDKVNTLFLHVFLVHILFRKLFRPTVFSWFFAYSRPKSENL